MDFGPIPQWVTAVIATAGGGIAIWSIMSQRAIARRRAAFDVFLKTETDEKMLTAYDNFHTGIIEMKKATSVDDFCTSEAMRPHYLWIRKYLNVHELIAVGIKEKVLDKDGVVVGIVVEQIDARERREIIVHVERVDEVVDFRRVRRRRKRRLAGQIQGLRVGAEIMIERDVFLKDHDDMLDRRCSANVMGVVGMLSVGDGACARKGQNDTKLRAVGKRIGMPPYGRV
jgi:hypothetical protein